MRELKGRTILITGAAGGIGRATALAFAEEGAHIVAVDVDEAGLDKLRPEVQARGVSCRVQRVDVADWSAVDALGARLEGEGVVVDVLVNNAGVLVGGPVSETSLETWAWMLGINLWGPIHFVRRFAGAMTKRRRGHIVNVASAAGLIGLPTIGAYSATKFAVSGFSQALRAELAHQGVDVTAVYPGIIRTQILASARTEGIDPSRAHQLVHGGLSPEEVAAQIVRAVRCNTPEIFPTALAKFGHAMNRLAPWLVRFATAQFAAFAFRRHLTTSPAEDRAR